MAQQLVLDPDLARASAKGTWRPASALLNKVRSFGYVPDFQAWKPGDLILVARKEPGLVQRRISAVQSRGYSADDARWHHAAVYVGDGFLCEATTHGVGWATLEKYILSHLVRVRRAPRLSDEDRWRLAVRAMMQLRAGYSFGTILKMALNPLAHLGFSGQTGELGRIPRSAVICSQLYADAYTLVTLQSLGNEAGQVPCPAYLSQTDHLRDVQTHWLAISNQPSSAAVPSPGESPPPLREAEAAKEGASDR